MHPSSFIARRRRAIQAAAELLDDLDIDQENPVDVFGAIPSLGMWLVFQPLHHLLGAVISQGSGGVMITTQRETAIQRYTAAHEIGHWVLDYNRTAFDTETDILNTGAAERERVAQWFASYFLMPPPLVHATVSRHRASSDRVTPAIAYLAARDMQVSYEAAVRQMANVDMLTDHQRDDLLGVSRMQAKQELAFGHRPQVGVADLWLVDGPPATLEHVDLVVNDEIVVALPENRTTGYRWLDDTAMAQRSTRRARPAPPAFDPVARSAPIGTPDPLPPPRTGADTAAALSLLPRAERLSPGTSHGPTANPDESGAADTQSAGGLQVVMDDYRPGWARILTRDPAPVRRYIAGAAVDPDTLVAPRTDTEAAPDLLAPTGRARPDPNKPGAGATGQRLLALQAGTEGQFRHSLHYASVHDPATPPAATYTIQATVNVPPMVQHRRALLDIDLNDESEPLLNERPHDGPSGQDETQR
jgi:predicted secreted protein